jgi:hypothetical protein
MRKGILLAAGLGLVLTGAGVAIARPAFLQAATDTAPTAELKVGLGIEKMEITGEAAAFKVAAGTKIYVWTKVAGCADSKITIAFQKGDKVATRQELSVPRSPYRTNAYRTFRAGDEGEWTAKVLGAEGQELGSASFKVELEK